MLVGMLMLMLWGWAVRLRRCDPAYLDAWLSLVHNRSRGVVLCWWT